MRGRAGRAIDDVIAALDRGRLRVAEPSGDDWVVHAWIKQAILLYFARRELAPIGDARGLEFFDKLPVKHNYKALGVRCVPPGVARYGSFLGRGAILMPGFVNIGAYVDEGTMVDTWTTVGSCAQIGQNCHISAAAQIGGVLEPIGALPVIIEDDVMIGGNSGVYEGTIVKHRAVLGTGTILNRSIPVYDLVRDEIYTAADSTPLIIPEAAIVVPGSRAISNERAAKWKLSLQCAVIVKYRDAKTDARVTIEDLLR